MASPPIKISTIKNKSATTISEQSCKNPNQPSNPNSSKAHPLTTTHTNKMITLLADPKSSNNPTTSNSVLIPSSPPLNTTISSKANILKPEPNDTTNLKIKSSPKAISTVPLSIPTPTFKTKPEENHNSNLKVSLKLAKEGFKEVPAILTIMRPKIQL